MIIYSRPPYPDIYYPYLILSATDKSTEKYVRTDWGIRYIIIDSGVYRVFHKDSRTEYPGGYKYWVDKVASLWVYASKFVKNVYVTIPDYPADYPHNPVPQNIERTIRNIEYALEKYPNVKWLVPIQGLPNSLSSVVRTIRVLKEGGLLKSDYVAIAPTCVTRNTEFLRRLALTVRTHLPNYKIHMFGVIKRSWDRIKDYVFSVDTVTYAFYCSRLFKRKFCLNTKENIIGWLLFLRDLVEGGYVGPEVFGLSLETAKRKYGIPSNELLRYLEYTF